MRSASTLATILVLSACGDATPSLADVTTTDIATDSDTAPDAITDATTADVASDSVTPIDIVTTDTHDADVSQPPPDFYDPDVLHTVAITMTAQDWELLRHETRALSDIIGRDCLAAPVDSPFNWYHADVTIDGVTAHDVGVRKKGFLGSLDSERPALRIEADHYVDDGRIGELEHVTLNNGRQDPSRLKQCLAYEIFRAAGIAASRCSFSHVTVNGFDLGLYTDVEPIKKRFIRSAFGEAAPAIDRPNGLGQLWEGALSDFREGWLGTFDAKFDEVPKSTAPLDAVTIALDSSDETLVDALDGVIDLDEFMTFWATEVLVSHWDGYAGNTNNFYVYHDQDQRLRFIPWGVDGTFVTLASRGPARPSAVLAVGAIAHRLHAHPVGRARYEAELARLLSEVWDEASLLARVDAWDTLTASAREPSTREDGAIAVTALKLNITQRREAIEDELGHVPPVNWPDPLREPPCAKPTGTVVGSFETTWGTWAEEDLFMTGKGTLVVTSDSLPNLSFVKVGAKAGENPAAPGLAEVIVAAQVVGAGFVAILFHTPLPLAPGEQALDVPGNEAWVYYLEPPNDPRLVGFLGEGSVVFEAGEDMPEAPIEATFSATLFTL